MKEDSSIITYSGNQVDVFNPDPNSITIEDGAHALSLLCRFGGHTPRMFSVAEHSLHVMDLLPHHQKLAGLMHDFSEAFLIDIPRPIKHNLPQYMELEDSLMAVIAKKFGFRYPFDPEIKQADMSAFNSEWGRVINAPKRTLIQKILGKNRLKLMSSKKAERKFLKAYKKLTK